MNAFDHYIALDWSMNNMAIAKLTAHSEKATVVDVPSDIFELKLYLDRLKGKKILCFEESTPAHWLYVELKSSVDEIIVCDPYRNHLLKDGGKTDKLDAIRLAQLLRAGLLKQVFHSDDELIYLRKVVHGYEEVVRAGVRLKNQNTALFRGIGLNKNDTELPESHKHASFVLQGINDGIERYEIEKVRYEKEFRKIICENLTLRNLQTIPGIGLIGSIKILATVVDPKRFLNKSNWLSYCGLIRHDLISGGRSYGKRNPRFSRSLKCVFKTAAVSVLSSYSRRSEEITDHSEPLKRYYHYLITEKKYPEHHARHAVARRIAVLCLGVMKSQKALDDRWRKKDELKNV